MCADQRPNPQLDKHVGGFYMELTLLWLQPL